MTRIILVRHGQTKWNTGVERFRGRSDIKLDDVGIQQAEATADRITQWRVSAVYSSPQPRAIQTAQPIARRFNLSAQPLEGLIDVDFGEWQGLSLEEAKAKDSNLYKLWFQNPHLITFPGGESLEQARKRVVAAIESLAKQHQEQDIVCVSHKVICMILLCSLLGLDSSHFWQVAQDTCAINLIEEKNQSLVVRLLNDTCHLEGIK